MIGTLIQKNVRVLRSGWLSVLVVTALAYATVTVVSWVLWREMIRSQSASVYRQELALNFLSGKWWQAEVFVPAAVVSLFTACVILPTIAGVSVATERQDRSADFEFMLPISRRTRVLSKFATVLGVAGLLLLMHVVCYGLAYRVTVNGIEYRYLYGNQGWRPDMFARMIDDTHTVWTYGVIAFVCGTSCGFGLAWLMTTLIRSPAIATAIAVGVMLGLALVYIIIPQMTQANSLLRGTTERDAFLKMLSSFSVVSLGLGVIGLVVGAIVMLRRRGA